MNLIGILQIVIDIVIFGLILSFLVLIHELGHYFAARWAKVTVEEFGLGYPPRAKTLFVKAGTVFSLNWIPFGGFVKMEGEDGPEVRSENQTTPQLAGKTDKIDKKQVKTDKKSHQSRPPVVAQTASDTTSAFYTKTVWQRLVILLGGVTVNFLFGVLAFSIFFAFKGIPTPIDQARIEAVQPGSPAETAGVATNVNIIAIKTLDSESQEEQLIPVQTNQEVIDAVAAHAGRTINLVTTGDCSGLACQELSQEFSVYVRTPQELPTLPSGEKAGAMGVSFANVAFVSYPWYEMVWRSSWYGLQQALGIVLLTVVELQRMLGKLFASGEVPTQVAGVVGIAHQVTEYQLFDQGWLMILNFAGFISVSLAIMNLLPIPALDGGRVLFVLAETVVGRKRISKVEGYANYGGFILLIGLLILITIKDVWNIIG